MKIAGYEPNKRVLVILGSTAATYLISSYLLKLYFRYKKNQLRKSYPADTVILHQFPVKEGVPSISTPCLKLETWLRFAEIKYQNEYSYLDRSSQGQMPYVTLNGKDYHDSQFIIENLSQIYGKDLDENLNKTEKAIARSFLKLIEESFKWSLYFHRFLAGSAADVGMPSLLFKVFKPKLVKALNIQGYGRHTKEEVFNIGKQDLQALEDFLHNKTYLFGENLSVDDAVLFAFISQVAYYDKGVLNAFLRGQCPNLLAHFNSIKAKYWPEWKSIA